MTPRFPVSLLLVLAVLLVPAAPAAADVTAFLGAATTPSNRPVRGFAAGLGLLAVGFEFEYSDAAEDLTTGSPSLRTGMGNVYVQNPFPISGLQFYATAGAGFYRETLAARQETSGGTNVGGGVKISLIGPLRLRLDYRVFRLGGDALHRNPQRIYAGLTLAF